MKLQVEITRQDYADFCFYHFRKNRLLKTIINGVLGYVITLIVIFHRNTHIYVTALAIASIAYIIIYFFLIYYSLDSSRNIPLDNGSTLGRKDFEFSDDGINVSDNNSSSQYSWRAIKTLDESKKAFYLYVDANMAIVIPKRCFLDKQEEDSFGKYTRDKIIIS